MPHFNISQVLGLGKLNAYLSLSIGAGRTVPPQQTNLRSREVERLKARNKQLRNELRRLQERQTDSRTRRYPATLPAAPLPEPPDTPEARRALEAIRRRERWYHRIEVSPGVVTPGKHNSQGVLDALELPEDLSGKRVLDIGARDGFFSFAAERRGADVLAVDAVAPDLTGFKIAAELLNSKVRYEVKNLYDLSPEREGTFDGILFLGVLYHLKNPLLGLDVIWELAKEGATLWVESFVCDHHFWPSSGRAHQLASYSPDLEEIPLARYYPRTELGGEGSNWWGPNLAALRAMVESTGFEIEKALISPVNASRGIVVARKVPRDEEARYFHKVDKGTVETAGELKHGGFL